MPPSIIIRRILLTTNQHLGMEQLAIITRADLVNGTRIQINKDRTRHVFTAARLCEYGIQLAGIMQVFGVGVGSTVFLEAMLEEVTGRRGVCVRIE